MADVDLDVSITDSEGEEEERDFDLESSDDDNEAGGRKGKAVGIQGSDEKNKLDFDLKSKVLDGLKAEDIADDNGDESDCVVLKSGRACIDPLIEGSDTKLSTDLKRKKSLSSSSNGK